MKFFNIFKKKIKTSNIEIVDIPVDKIVSNPYQPRRYFNTQRLSELSLSIKEYGVIQPILVRPNNFGGYELVAGERRLRASRLVSKKTIPSIIKNLSDKEMIEIAFLENLQREPMTALEEAETYRRLAKEFVNLTVDELGNKIGKTSAEIAAKLWILELPMIVRKALDKGMITESHAKLLFRLPDEQEQIKILTLIAKEGLSVKKTKQFIDKLISEKLREQQFVNEVVKKALTVGDITEQQAREIKKINLPDYQIKILEFVINKKLDLEKTKKIIEKIKEKIKIETE